MIVVDVKKKIKTYNGFNEFRLKASFAMAKTTKLYGPSGVGKTTLLKIVAGLINPEEGIITVHNDVWLDTHKKICVPPQKREIGFVFQNYALFPNMTVEQHLRYGTQNSSYIQELLTLGEMENFKKHKPQQLSGGQQQRLAILRALSTKPKILLMDEPFSALDNALKYNLMTNLKQLLTNLNTTCIVVTHHPFETEGFAENAIELS